MFAKLTILSLKALIPLIFAGTYTHSQALKKISDAGIGITSSKRCSDRNKLGCTSLDGVHSEVIDGPNGIITLKKAIGRNCPITITGGTEVGHQPGEKSHGSGWKLDLHKEECLTNYIKKTFQPYTTNKWRSASGNIYYDEGNHWDVVFH